MTRPAPLLAAAAVAATLTAALAQHVTMNAPPASTHHRLASNVVVPQARVMSVHPVPTVELRAVNASVKIVAQVATTTIDLTLFNPGRHPQEAQVVLPIPAGATISGFSFDGGMGGEAELLDKDEAAAIYRDIVNRLRDPALLEFVDCAAVRSSIFPIEARQERRVRIVYEEVLPADGNRVDYVLPRTAALDYTVPWTVKIELNTQQPISAVYSPTHDLKTQRHSVRHMAIDITEPAGNAAARLAPGSIRLSYLLQRDGVTATLLAYPDPSIGGGYFLLLAGLPADATAVAAERGLKREVTIVLDRSGSMGGDKIAQAREAARQIIGGLADGEFFNLIIYNDAVQRFSVEPTAKSADSMTAAEQFLAQVTAQGGTNIHAALTEALAQPPTAGTLPIVLFLTDGLPTVGNTSELAIREVAEQHNPHHRRIFTFGVGYDVNAPLLDKIAGVTRAKATYVLPTENVEVKVGQVFRQLVGPVLADVKLDVQRAGQDGPMSGMPPAYELLPGELPDLFEGDQLIVLGKYRAGGPAGETPLRFTLTGDFLGKSRTFTFDFTLDSATTKNAFVPRLWASRRIAVLVDAVRQLGAEGNIPDNDPRLTELTDEIVRLSQEYGIMTEYTAFLAREGTDLADARANAAQAVDNLRQRAIETRSGIAAVNQAANYQAQVGQSKLNASNSYLDEQMNRVEITSVQQVADLAFYRRGQRWIDSRASGETAEPTRTIEFGSDEFWQIAQKLRSENRGGALALRGEMVLMVDGEPVLLKAP